MGINIAAYANKNTMAYDAAIQRHANKAAAANMIGGIAANVAYSTAHRKEINDAFEGRRKQINNDAKTFSTELNSELKKKKKYHQ